MVDRFAAFLFLSESVCSASRAAQFTGDRESGAALSVLDQSAGASRSRRLKSDYIYPRRSPGRSQAVRSIRGPAAGNPSDSGGAGRPILRPTIVVGPEGVAQPPEPSEKSPASSDLPPAGSEVSPPPTPGSDPR